MSRIVRLDEGIRELLFDGAKLALEGFSHLVPFAAGHEIIRQGFKDLKLYRMAPDIIGDQMIGMGCISELNFGWSGNPGVGSLHRFRDAVENEFPTKLLLRERTHAGMAAGFSAGAANIPFSVVRGHTGTDLSKIAEYAKNITCPFTGENLTAIEAIRPDVGIIHAQQVDRKGNVHLWGLTGIQKEAIYSSKRNLVTVEELVESFEPHIGSIVLSRNLIDLVAISPSGASPSYSQDYYLRDDAFYLRWETISKNYQTFFSWMEENVLSSTISKYKGQS
jgi:glutaconate CoA-transferase, subunit A